MKTSAFVLLFAVAVIGLAFPALSQGKGSLMAVVQQIQGDATTVIVLLPNGDEGAVAVNSKYPEGTEISTGDDVTMVIQLEGDVDGAPVPQALMSISPSTTILLDKMFMSADSATSRFALKNGEVRAKITTERADLSTDMKVATPTVTASITGTETRFGHNANRGSYVTVASGSVLAQGANGQTRNVSGGTGLNEGDSSVIGNALSGSSTSNAPIGSVTYEVGAGQLTFAGGLRAGSDANNPATNPSGARGPSGDDLRGGFNPGQTLPSQPGR